ncbi:MAG: hypothetical protein KDM91_03725 [Verrucomicrobiae bacterium]|nr:hypothetical protein [Verrucomicrobiae bacterium]MCP5540003.1 hypothetical protein [Akkermansiaceae bacterium]MCP5549938.1 hypothetical protein [Akkermansiaceae bacterium]
MTRHEWHEPADDGERRFNRASIHAGRWTFETTLESDPDWTRIDAPPRAYLEALRDILWRKYQRGRLPHGHVKQIDRMIEDAKRDDSPAA